MKAAYKVSLIILIFLFIVYLYSSSKTSTSTVKNIGAMHLAGSYQLQIKLDPKKPKTGNNQLSLLVLDPQDQVVTDADIQIYAEMPAMGSMQAMREVVSIENEGAGLYQGEYTLPMNGLWPLTVNIDSPKWGKAQLNFDMSTSRTGLKLTMATASELSPKVTEESTEKSPEFPIFTVDSYRRQLIGVTTAEVICQEIIKTIKVRARVTYDQSALTDITLKYDAWIGELNADYVGKHLQQGDTLLTVYSPELLSAQDEYLDSLKQGNQYGLRRLARQRLMRWGMNATQIKALAKRGRSHDYMPIISTVSGVVIGKKVVAGSAVKSGGRLLRLANLSTILLEGDVYETDLAWLKKGMDVEVILANTSKPVYHTQINFIDPRVNPQTRSTIIRASLANPDGVLSPGMYAMMNVQVNLGRRLVVPEEAVIYSGEQRIVFVDLGDGRLQPKKIRTGIRNNDMIEVVEGLNWGDKIIVSGNFLIAAESKFKSGLAQW